MAESQSMGGIHYDVAMDVQPMLSGERQVNTSLDRMEGNFNKASKSIDVAEKSMLSFSKAALAVSSALSVGVIVNAVDEWGQMAARIKMALKSVEGDVERYSEIQERFLEISNRNGKAIETVQALYAGSASSMKELGYNTIQTVDYIESLSSAFTANATGAQQTESAMNALNRAMVVGTLKGNDWHSILNATPSVVGDIAKELSRMRGGVKVTENDVKKMAMESGISMRLFSNAMINAREENNALADSMDNTVADGFTKLINSAKAYYGEMNQTLGITRSVSAGFAVLTENFDKVSSAIAGVAAIGAARYFGSLASSIKTSAIETLNQSKALKENANAQLVSAQQAQRRAAAEVRNAQLDRARLQNNIDQNKRSQQSVLLSAEITAAQQRERAAKLALAQANNTVAVSQERINLASSIGARAVSTLRASLALVGGPMGAAMIAAGSVLYYWQQADVARQKSLDFADSIEELKNKLKELSAVSIEGEIAKANRSIEAQKDAISELESEIESLNVAYKLASNSSDVFGGKASKLAEANDNLKIKTAELEDRKRKLAETIGFTADATGELAEKNKDLYDAMNNATTAAGKMGGVIGALQKRIKDAAAAKEQLNDAMRDNPRTDSGDKAILDLKEQNELLAIKDKRQRAIRKAEMEAAKLTQNGEQAKDIIALATANYDLSEAERERGSKAKASAKTTDEAGEALKRLQTELTRLNQGYAEGSLELAQYDAAQALGAKASPEQIALAKERAKSIWEVQAATKAATKAEEDRKNSQANFTSLQESVSPVTAIDNQFAKQMEQINQYKQLYPQSIAEAEALRSQIEEQYRQKRMDAQWQEYAQSSVMHEAMASAFDSLAGNASNALTGVLTKSMTAEEAMRSLGRTVLNSVVNSFVQMGIEQAKSAWMGAAQQQAAIATTTAAQVTGIATQTAASTTAAATTTAAWTPAAIMSSIASWGGAVAIGLGAIAAIGLSGKRKNGGPVGAGQMYQVGEGGKPEIFKASTGKQYMIPGDNGRVISNKDMQGGGGGVQAIINIQNYTSASVDARATESNNGVTIDVIVADIYRGGQISQAIERNHQAPRRATE